MNGEEKVYFKPRARLMKILGNQLISSEVIALVELVKNSYDADATEVRIVLNNITSTDGEIIIEDNGIGIPYDKIKNVWFEPATSEKSIPEEKRYSKCFKRKLLGEKGIGRFAVHRLGNKILLISRATKDCFKTLEELESIFEINWKEFIDNKYLEEIIIPVKKRKPIHFMENHGVYIKICDICPWKKNTIKHVVRKIRSLETPKIIKKQTNTTKINDKFKIIIEANDPEIQNIINEVKNIDEILQTAFYVLHGSVDRKGILHYEYYFNRPDYPELRRIKKGKVDLKEFNNDFFEDLMKTYNSSLLRYVENDFYNIFPGEFYVDFYVWDLDSSALKISGLKKDYQDIIRPNSGVRIYRDGFRVWPYGEEDDDWLGLDLRRLNAPKERLISRNQIIGFISISSEKNPGLIDQSNREGLQKNQQYEIFYELVRAALKHMANLRKEDKIKMDRVRVKKSLDDDVTQKINKLKRKMEKNNHLNIYEKEIGDLETTYRKRVEDILERYMQAAALGIAYSLPVHEMNIRFRNLRSFLKEIEKNPDMLNRYLRELEKQLGEAQNIVKIVGNLMKRQKSKEISLIKVVKNVIKLKERELRKYNIDFKILYDEDIKIKAVGNLISTALLNLIDNSIYWIRVKAMKMRERGQKYRGEIKIIIGIDENNNPFVSVVDNGTGVSDPLDILVEPYYSRKSDGFGLGLYIVDNIMKRHEGKLEAYNNKYGGATFRMVFLRKEGVVK